MENRRVDIDEDCVSDESCSAIGDQGVVVVFGGPRCRRPYQRDTRVDSDISTSRATDTTAIDVRSVDLYSDGDDVSLRAADIIFGGNDIGEGAPTGMISDALWFDPNTQR